MQLTAGLVQSLENESSLLKAPAISPEFVVARPAAPRPADVELLIR
jgi:hypothetical protein